MPTFGEEEEGLSHEPAIDATSITADHTTAHINTESITFTANGRDRDSDCGEIITDENGDPVNSIQLASTTWLATSGDLSRLTGTSVEWTPDTAGQVVITATIKDADNVEALDDPEDVEEQKTVTAFKVGLELRAEGQTGTVWEDDAERDVAGGEVNLFEIKPIESFAEVGQDPTAWMPDVAESVQGVKS